MSINPTLNRIINISIAEDAVRARARWELNLRTVYAEACKTCPQPVWFTAFFDGTGNNYDADGEGGEGGSTRVDKVKYSNVSKLAHFAHIVNRSIPRTRYEYIEGVGTPCSKVGDSSGGGDKVAGMAAATKGEARIRWMLDALKKHVDEHMPFVNQINLAVFGFSRGAAQARAFVRMLTEKLCYEQGDHKLYWREPGMDGKQPLVVVYFVGIFDTVASVGYGGSRMEKKVPGVLVGLGGLPMLGGPVWASLGGFLHAIDDGGHAAWARDMRIPLYVRRCVHYVAGHEVREKFPSDSVREDQDLPGHCAEWVYPGVHSDVGGGYEFRLQEGRTNELARVALNNMFIEAWKAGVPLKSAKEVMATAGSLFEISADLESVWNAYMCQGDVKAPDGPPSPGRLETAVIWHMNRYYHWRASRRRRLRDGRLKPAGGVDKYMKTTDSEWDTDIVNAAEARTGAVRYALHPNGESIYEAFTGKWIELLRPDIRQRFDRFFDHYVHDSIAGFKDAVGPIDESRWSVNRKIFMGKREGKFLYWRYEGWFPEYNGTRISDLRRSELPPEMDLKQA
jgi:hypothetical protein